MPEGCPLGPGLYWQNRGAIPEFCEERCGGLMEEAMMGASDGPYDQFVDDIGEDGCVHSQHGLETEDVSLQLGNGAERIVGVTDNCEGCGTEYGAFSYVYICPNDRSGAAVFEDETI